MKSSRPSSPQNSPQIEREDLIIGEDLNKNKMIKELKEQVEKHKEEMATSLDSNIFVSESEPELNPEIEEVNDELIKAEEDSKLLDEIEVELDKIEKELREKHNNDKKQLERRLAQLQIVKDGCARVGTLPLSIDEKLNYIVAKMIIVKKEVENEYKGNLLYKAFTMLSISKPENSLLFTRLNSLIGTISLEEEANLLATHDHVDSFYRVFASNMAQNAMKAEDIQYNLMDENLLSRKALTSALQKFNSKSLEHPEEIKDKSAPMINNSLLDDIEHFKNSKLKSSAKVEEKTLKSKLINTSMTNETIIAQLQEETAKIKANLPSRKLKKLVQLMEDKLRLQAIESTDKDKLEKQIKIINNETAKYLNAKKFSIFHEEMLQGKTAKQKINNKKVHEELTSLETLQPSVIRMKK